MSRNIGFLLFNVLYIAAFLNHLRNLMVVSWDSLYYTYIPFIPIITAYLIFESRKSIFTEKSSSFAAGMIIMLAGLLLLLSSRSDSIIEQKDRLTIVALSLILVWTGGFTFCFGMNALRRAAFPLLFLIVAVPIPDAILEKAIVILQRGSAEISYILLRATGMPIARDGFVFHLPTIDIEVAKECSGIRSSLSLIITGILAAHFFLRTIWARIIFILSIVPIAIIKNGIRITVLSVLGVYWDERILASDLHRKGGIVFFLIALMLAGMIIMLLKKMEKRSLPVVPKKDSRMGEVIT